MSTIGEQPSRISYLHSFCLTYTMGASDSLQIILRIPVGITHDHSACFGQIDALREGHEDFRADGADCPNPPRPPAFVEIRKT